MRPHYVPRVLPMAPRPRPDELRSSWLRRVAAANALTLRALLEALATILPSSLAAAVSLDYRCPRPLCNVVSRWCRLPVSHVDTLDLAHRFPTTPSDWFVHDPEALGGDGLGRFTPVLRLCFCPPCLKAQQQRGDPLHLCATWSLAWLTHCPHHHTWLLDACLACHRPDALDFGAAWRGDLCCRFCGGSLNWPVHASASLTPVLQLQRSLLAYAQRQRPEPSWVGRCEPRAFLQLARDLLQLVMRRDAHDQAILADYLPERHWDYPRRRLRAHHRFPTLRASQRLVLLSAVTALLRGASAADPSTVDPLRRLWQVLTPPHRRALAEAVADLEEP